MKYFVACLLLGVAACNDTPKVVGTTAVAFDEGVEKAAILKTIEAETDAFYKRDYSRWKQQFIQAPYAFQGWSNADGTFDASTGWEAIDKRIGDYMKTHPLQKGETAGHPRVERRNITVQFFSPDLAYLVWDQYNGDSNGKQFTWSKDQRLVQKEDNEWKIANVSSFWDYKKKIPVDSLP